MARVDSPSHFVDRWARDSDGRATFNAGNGQDWWLFTQWLPQAMIGQERGSPPMYVDLWVVATNVLRSTCTAGSQPSTWAEREGGCSTPGIESLDARGVACSINQSIQNQCQGACAWEGVPPYMSGTDLPRHLKLQPAVSVRRLAGYEPETRANGWSRWLARVRLHLRTALDHEGFVVIFALFTLLYLVVIVIDLLLDELFCDDPAMRPFLNRKDAVLVRIDVSFLSIFLVEIMLRVYAEGLRYLASVIAAIDAAIVLSGVVADVIMLASTNDDNMLDFTFLRMLRMLRLARIANTLRRFFQSRDEVLSSAEALAASNLHRVFNPPKCNWIEAGRQAGLEAERSATPDGSFVKRGAASGGHGGDDPWGRLMEKSLKSSLEGPQGKPPSPDLSRQLTAALTRQLTSNSSAGGASTLRAHQQHTFAAFISHRKDEAAAHARFLHDQLELICGEPLLCPPRVDSEAWALGWCGLGVAAAFIARPIALSHPASERPC